MLECSYEWVTADTKRLKTYARTASQISFVLASVENNVLRKVFSHVVGTRSVEDAQTDQLATKYRLRSRFGK